MGEKLNPDQLRAAEETMAHFPKGQILGISSNAQKAIKTAEAVHKGVSPITPRAAFSSQRTDIRHKGI